MAFDFKKEYKEFLYAEEQAADCGNSKANYIYNEVKS